MHEKYKIRGGGRILEQTGAWLVVVVVVVLVVVVEVGRNINI